MLHGFSLAGHGPVHHFHQQFSAFFNNFDNGQAGSFVFAGDNTTVAGRTLVENTIFFNRWGENLAANSKFAFVTGVSCANTPKPIITNRNVSRFLFMLVDFLSCPIPQK